MADVWDSFKKWLDTERGVWVSLVVVVIGLWACSATGCLRN